MEQIDLLISEAKDVAKLPYDSPRYELWENKVKNFMSANFDQDTVKIFENAIRYGAVWSSDDDIQDEHEEHIRKAVDLLEALKDQSLDTVRLVIGPKDADLVGLHIKIKEGCTKLFMESNYSEAVEKSFKIVRARLRDLTGFETGTDAFGKTELHIGGAAGTHADDDFQHAVKFLLMSIDRFRNEKAHVVDGNINEKQRAKEYLTLSSLAMHHLDNAEIIM